ncbi:phosphatidylinositol-3,5-bisphosphate 5-phosphatase [Ascosphaera aggregata]|nr:phosphatidylinositol-3,5-bisphosphate 5-phosphatase [Ascosphaera aggregata]
MSEFSSAHKPLQQWLQNIPSSSTSHADNDHVLRSIIKHPHFDLDMPLPSLHAIAETPSEYRRGRDEKPSARSRTPSTRTTTAATLEDIVTHALHPSVSKMESEEYERYVNHPLKVPLVVTSDDSLPPASVADNPAVIDLLEYMDQRLLEDVNLDALAEENLLTYNEYVKVRPEGLSVLKDDHLEKRYRLYGSWTKGKSVLKQRVDG